MLRRTDVPYNIRDVRPEKVAEVESALEKLRDLVTSLNTNETAFLTRNSVAYRKLYDTFRASIRAESTLNDKPCDTDIKPGDFVAGTNLGATNEDIEGKTVLVKSIRKVRGHDWLTIEGSSCEWLASHFRIATRKVD